VIQLTEENFRSTVVKGEGVVGEACGVGGAMCRGDRMMAFLPSWTGREGEGPGNPFGENLAVVVAFGDECADWCGSHSMAVARRVLCPLVRPLQEPRARVVSPSHKRHT
jgi:hypothetical protein